MASTIIQVTATQPWVFTGFQCVAGNTYQIQTNPASRWNTNPAYPPCGASGNGNHCTYDYCYSGAGAIEGQLLGVIQSAPNPRPSGIFIVGASLVFVAPSSGPLYLSINDDYRVFADNSGLMEVTIYY